MSHEKIVRADDRVFSEFGGAMHGDMFAKDVVFTNPQASGGAFVFEILGRLTDDAAGEKLVMSANSGQPGKVNVRADSAMGPKLYTFIDYGIRSDLDCRIEPGFGMDNGGRMNHAVEIEGTDVVAKLKTTGDLECRFVGEPVKCDYLPPLNPLLRHFS